MTYETDAAKADRKPLTVVALVLDNRISDTGSERFCDANVPLGQTFEPCLERINYSPTKITEDGLGYRCTVTVTLQDFAHPSGKGTYLARLIGANPYYIDRRLVIYRGFEHSPFSLDNMKRGDYFIKKITGPDEKGRVTITAADILTKLDGDQAVWPPVTYGNLASSLTSSATGSINIGDNTNFTSTSYAIIDSEIVSLSAVTGSTSVTISGRGQFGTEAVAHDAGAPVRRVAAFNGINVVDMIYSLIDVASPIDVSTYIDLSAWEDERDAYLASDDIYGIVKEPTPVKDIISKLCKQFNVAVWWDDEVHLIKLKALGPTIGAPTAINTDHHILNVGHSITRDQSKALSQVWIYYGKIDHSKGDDAENFQYVYAYQDSGIEGSDGLGQPCIEKIEANFIGASGTSSASKTATRMAGQRKTGIVECKFRLDVRDATLNVGDGVQITSDLIQGEDGEPVTAIYMVTERMREDTYVQYSAVAMGVEVDSRYGYVAPNSTPNYTSATAAQRNRYAWIASASTGQLSNGDSAYLMI